MHDDTRSKSASATCLFMEFSIWRDSKFYVCMTSLVNLPAVCFHGLETGMLRNTLSPPDLIDFLSIFVRPSDETNECVRRADDWKFYSDSNQRLSMVRTKCVTTTGRLNFPRNLSVDHEEVLARKHVQNMI